MEIPKISPKKIEDAKIQYLQILCPPEHEKEMLKAIQDAGYAIHDGFPKTSFKAGGKIAFLIYELDVPYNIMDIKQNQLIKKQDEFMGF